MQITELQYDSVYNFFSEEIPSITGLHLSWHLFDRDI